MCYVLLFFIIRLENIFTPRLLYNQRGVVIGKLNSQISERLIW